ncbi:MAG: hypothetical protein AAGL66_02055, partial [Pseudomonadota bacterium]
MKQAGLMTAAILAVIALVYLRGEQGAQPELPDSAALPETVEPPGPTASEAEATEPAPPIGISGGEATTNPELVSELQAALAQLAVAESALRDSERDVAELEAMIDEI